MRNVLTRSVLLLSSLVAACDGDPTADDAAVEAAALAPRGASPPQRRYIVSWRDGANGVAALARAGAVIVRDLPDHHAVAARLSPEALGALARDPEIVSVEEDPVRVPDGLGSGQSIPYGIAMTQADLLPAGSAQVTVCIIDSGFATDHEDLQDVLVDGVNDAVYGTSWQDDQCGHGTHVGGIVAALDNQVGVVGVNGTGNVLIRSVKVFVGPSCEKTYGSDLVAALAACRSGVVGRLVVSMSLGGDVASSIEEAAFAAAANEGVLMVASAGNGGNTNPRYPAAYTSVIAVGAIHESKAHWTKSQRFDDMELVAPGVGVASTVPWSTAAVSVAGEVFGGRYVLSSARASVTGTLIDGASCSSAGAWSGAIVRCRLGSISFATQVQLAAAGGAVGVLLYSSSTDMNDTPYLTLAPYSSALPVLGLNRRDGEALAPFLGRSASLDTTKVTPASGYEAWNGTSMAVPYVSGIAAKVWSNLPAATNVQVRWALAATAEDLGTSGRDRSFGFGLVKGMNALSKLQTGSCKANGAACSKATDCCSLSCTGKANKATCK